MRSSLRWFGVALGGATSLVGLALAPASGGLTLVLGVPAAFLTASLLGRDPAERSDLTRGAAVALTLGVLVVVWVFVCLLRDTTVLGRSH